jgi:uncharacterized protein YkwD
MRRPAFLAAVVAVATLLISNGARADSPTPDSYAARLVALVNLARYQHGLRPLTLENGTTSVALTWTQHMAAERLLAHNPQLGPDLSTHGSTHWRSYGENVGMGSAQDPDGLFAAYWRSPEHRANILDRHYRYVGVAVEFTRSRAWNTFDFVDVYRAAGRDRSRGG